jgi:hypothetical protein
VANSHKSYPTRRARFITAVVIIVGAVLLYFAGPSLAQTQPHKATCDGTPEQTNPNIGGGGSTSYPRTYKVDGLKVKPMVQFTYPHQVMGQVHVIGNAQHGNIAELHVAMVYVGPDGTETTCQMEKGAASSLHGNWVDDLDTAYWWVQSPSRGDRILVQVQVTVFNPKTGVSRPFGNITRLRIPL